MSQDLLPVPSAPALPAVDDLEKLAAEADAYAACTRAPATLRAYRADLAHFARWTAHRGLAALPATPETVALYVADLARQRRPATITRRLAAISIAHRLAGWASPTSDPRVSEVLTGVRRRLGTDQRRAAPLSTADLVRMLAALPADTPGAWRDRALLLVGFAGALRAGELVGLDVEDLEGRPEGMVAWIRRSKTDQEAAGELVALPYGREKITCPVSAIKDWLDRAGIDEGPVFRPVDRHGRVGPGRLGAQSVSAVIRRAAVAAGLDMARLSGHSLRAGFATTAAAAGASERAIAQQTRHKSLTMVHRYVRLAAFSGNAVAALGL